MYFCHLSHQYEIAQFSGNVNLFFLIWKFPKNIMTVILHFGLEIAKVDNTCNFIFSHNHAFKLTTHNPVKR